MEKDSNIPLCVDLDGSLIRSDLLFESFLKLIKKNPLYVFMAVYWLGKGKAYLKSQIAARVELAVDTLPYNAELLEFIESERDTREIVLATASHSKFANAVAAHLGVFDQVVASSGDCNLRSQAKADVLSEMFGRGQFDYVGNDDKDWPVWAAAQSAYVVSGDRGFINTANARVSPRRVFRVPEPGVKTVLKAMRIHQWAKNLLLFVPFILDQRFHDLKSFIILCGCFLCFSCLASATYILNDLLDLEADRNNASKKTRPFAAGTIPIQSAFVMMGVLFAIVIVLLLFLPGVFGAIVLLYFVVTLSYSFSIKAIPILDVCCLASLYTIRVIGGGLVIGTEWSFWLLAFSMFFFLSLALAKRVSELKNIERKSGQVAQGRGYSTADIPVLLMMGVSSGYLSVLVVAFYINSTKVVEMYEHIEILWLICPILLYWIGRVWLYTSRGEMHEDPIIYAIKDRGSRVAAFMCLVVLLIAIFNS
jgi:4-hydroxybenzoate polyprenyltransferase